MSEILIVTANASHAKIFSSTLKNKKDIKIVGQLEHPQSRMKGRDINTDGAGSFRPGAAAMATHAGQPDPKQNEWAKFARQLVEYIGSCYQQYENIVLCASPHFEGLLNKYIDKNIEQKIIKRITKDYTGLNNEELEQAIKNNITSSQL